MEHYLNTDHLETIKTYIDQQDATKVSTVAYDSTNHKITKTINGTTTDVVVLDATAGGTSGSLLPVTSDAVNQGLASINAAKQDTITSENKLAASLVSGLATVATSGDYEDLSNTPTIPAAQIQSDWEQATITALDYIKNKPTALSDFTDDLGTDPAHTHSQYLTEHQSLSAYRTAEAQNTIDSAKEVSVNKITSISSSSTNTQYPSALAVYNYVDAKIHVSTSEPTSSEGNNGDVWFVYEE